MAVFQTQSNFSRGELNPALHGRLDIEHYQAALKTCTNMTVLRQGALRRRPGAQFIAPVKDESAKTWLVSFVFSIEQAYVLEFGNLYFRVYANQGLVTEATDSITGATQANPVVLTVNNSLSNGDPVFVTGVVGMTQLNNREFTVANATGTTIELSGIDGTGFDAYTSGGAIGKIVEVTTPYATADLPMLQFAQSADTLYVAHNSYAPRKITRTSDTAWTVTKIEFQDGPYLKQVLGTATTMEPAGDGNVIPDMTGLTAPSGTVASSTAAAGAWQAADRDQNTSFSQSDSGDGWWEYDAGSSKTVTGYFLTAASGGSNANGMPLDFVFQGYTGSVWVTLDARTNEDTWNEGETRFYEFENETSYQKHRVKWTRIGAGSTTLIAEVGFKESADTMTAFSMTASAVTDINGGSGFQASDVGRAIRIRASDSRWRWFKITARTSTTVVDGVLYGQPLPDLDPTSFWRLGAWSSETGFPGSVTFFEQRLCWAATTEQPQNVWGSKSLDFEDHGVSDPLLADDAFDIEIASTEVNAIKWLEEVGDLLMGTDAAIRGLGPADTSEAFSATNLRQRRHTSVGSEGVQPVKTGTVLLAVQRFAKTLREVFFSFDTNSYQAPELTILSDHLYKNGVADVAYAQDPESIIWAAIDDGHLTGLTYERDQQVVAASDCIIAGGDADTIGTVESIATIPGADRTEVWMVVKRTINGGTHRYVELLAPDFDGGDLKDARFLDSFLDYSGTAVGTLGGLYHLEGETVWALADGVVFKNLTVTNGEITLPDSNTAANIAVGKWYQSKVAQLPPQANLSDGSHRGRIKSIGGAYVDVFETLGIKVGPEGSEVEVLERTADEAMDAQMALRTGVYPTNFVSDWDELAVLSAVMDDPLPATIRSLTRQMELEP